MGTFKQLTLAEREQLYLWRNQGIGWREIGRRLNRDHGGLIKEWQRNNRFVAYFPAKAQVRAETKSREQRRKAPLKSMHVWLYVQEHLRKPYYWTPEEIAGRLSLEYPHSLFIMRQFTATSTQKRQNNTSCGNSCPMLEKRE